MASTNFINQQTVIGSSWLNDADATVYGDPEEQTATAGQTVFVLTTITVSSGKVKVYINGSRQLPSSYTLTNPTTVTFTTGLSAGDEVMFEV